MPINAQCKHSFWRVEVKLLFKFLDFQLRWHFVEWRKKKKYSTVLEQWSADGLRNCRTLNCDKQQSGRCRWTTTNLRVRSAGVEPRVTIVAARGPERGLLKPGWGLSLPAATWHRPRAQGPIMQTWPRKPEQGRDSSIPQQASFSRQT